MGREPWLRVDLQANTLRLGSKYGGWTIIPDLIRPESTIISVGVGDDVTFDLAMIEHFGVTVHAFDPTPTVVSWMASQHLPAAFQFYALGLATYDGEAQFHAPLINGHISHSMVDRFGGRVVSVPVRRLASLMQQVGCSQIDVLKLDVEGVEYEVLDDILKSNIRVGQLLVEYHHRFPQIGVERTRQSIAKLQANGYRLFKISESGDEYSFLRPIDA